MTESEITSEFDVDKSEVEELKQYIETTSKEMFEEYGIDVDKETIILMQDQMIEDCFDIMNDIDWPANDTLIKASTPEEHFSNLVQEMKEGGTPAKMNMSVMAGTLMNKVDYDSPIAQYINTVLMEKYGKDY